MVIQFSLDLMYLSATTSADMKMIRGGDAHAIYMSDMNSHSQHVLDVRTYPGVSCNSEKCIRQGFGYRFSRVEHISVAYIRELTQL